MKQTVIEKSRKEYLKKVIKLKELLEGTEEGKLLDYKNSKLSLLNEIGIDANITIPFTKELPDGEYQALEEYIYHTSAENKLKLYTVDKFEDEIILTNPTIEKQLRKDITDKLIKEHFRGDKFEITESISLYAYDEDKAEPITIDLINRIIAAWNKLDYWCSLELKDNCIFLIDKEYKNKTNIVDIDNMDEISLKNNQIYIGFLKEDEYKFDGCSINEYGIEY